MAATIAQLEERLRLATRVHEQLSGWHRDPPRLDPGDWSGPASAMQERTAERMRDQLRSATEAAHELVEHATIELVAARG
ncbi:hypothetical protein [Schumannella sp. 10F1B-5-1]|uniref:hypothetical protein n=1 Tax=Schumannella sp. 10F1B-5-1 TaxID=2590780 RepID=UPI00113036E3|nr:hypothetical protein [Schumannella sp. 10F1B-5-1]TPW76805.1 hypothetical protein FJ658_02370 [Schumannella sp. 10F1B-5-1]